MREGIASSAKKVGDSLSELRRALGEQRAAVVEPTSRFIQERPLAAIGIAFGIGYVLGGGLFTGVTSRLLGLTWKVGGMALARSALGGNEDGLGQI